jgi:hypothetical protein
MNRDIIKQTALLEKKLGLIDNDLFKLILKDISTLISNHIIKINDSVEVLAKLKTNYKDKLHSLRQEQKEKSHQIDLEDSIRETKELMYKVIQAHITP